MGKWKLGIEGNPIDIMRNPINDLTISQGNDKLGKTNMWNFSLQPGRPDENGGSCPGATDWCRKFCYASTGYQSRMTWPMWKHNQIMSEKPDFVHRMIDALSKMRGKSNVMRLHVGGDFYNSLYIGKWYKIASMNLNWVFFGYTRSWRVPSLIPSLKAFASLPNVKLRASTDPLTGPNPVWLLEAGVDGYWSNIKPFPCPNLEVSTSIKCYKCRACFLAPKPILFPIHGVSSEAAYTLHKQMVNAGISRGFKPWHSFGHASVGRHSILNPYRFQGR